MAAKSRDFSLPAGMAPPPVGSAELDALIGALASASRTAGAERTANGADDGWMEVDSAGEARAAAEAPAAASGGAGAAAPKDPFVDAMLAPSLTRTENDAATYASSGSSLLDFFFSVLPDTPPEDVQRMLRRAWVEAPLDALQLAAHLRDVRDGKGERERFHDAAAWLAARHPRTLVANLEGIAQAGYWKDLLMLVERVCVGERVVESRRAAAKDRRATKGQGQIKRKAAKQERLASWRSHLSHASDGFKAELKAQRAAEVKAKDEQRVADAARERRERRASELDAARARLQDPPYRALHMTVAALFASKLKAEAEQLREGKPTSSLVAKWAPSPANAYDRRTLLATTIAAMLFPDAEWRRAGESDAQFADRTRGMLQKQYLTPLRAAAMLPEVAMSARAWDTIDYSRVASVCMKNNKKHFEAHDKERFEDFLSDVKAGKKTINAGALKPHELVEEVMNGDMSDGDLSMETVEAQWKTYVVKLRESGTLSSALAIADVSGSMSGTPMNVSIALSLLLSELAAPPFDRLVCTFSANPQLHRVTGDTLVERVQDVKGMDWGMNTNLQAVFELILQKALAAALKPEDMVKTLFIFSDMEFDAATTVSATWDPHNGYRSLPVQKTNFQHAKATFEEHGYALPRIVFWNLRGSDRGEGRNASAPVTKGEHGTALVSGFSGQLLKLFLANDLENMTPESIMLEAIKGGKYDSWTVVD